MNVIKTLVTLPMALGLGACASVDTATRNAIIQGAPFAAAPADQVATGQITYLSPQYSVTEIRINVPETLQVSEANLFFPVADIVWRGEAQGDRYAQVKAIFDEASQAGTANMTVGPKVIVEAEITRFHALTEKARYTIGGVHSLHFLLTVRDAATGNIIEGPRLVYADVKGTGGSAAIEDERRGFTQRVVIVNRLTEVINRELSHKRVGPAVPTATLEGTVAPTTVASLR